jgi:hypothetical protein
VLEDDLIARAVRQLAAALARTSAAETRAEGEVEARRTDAALGRAREALRRGDLRVALDEIDAAIAAATQLSASTALRLDARSLAALAPLGRGREQLARLFALRSTVLEAAGLLEEADRALVISTGVLAGREPK